MNPRLIPALPAPPRFSRRTLLWGIGGVALACLYTAAYATLRAIGVAPVASASNAPTQPLHGSTGYFPLPVRLANLPFDPKAPVGVAQPFMQRGTPIDALRAQGCLATAIYYEAASESEDGQRAVAQVVLNRVRHPAFPPSVCGVVFQGSARVTGCQFSFTCDGSMARAPSRRGWASASRIARAALQGAVYAPVGLATHYHSNAVSPFWAASLTRSGVVGAHHFYRCPGARGRRWPSHSPISALNRFPVRPRAALPPCPWPHRSRSRSLSARRSSQQLIPHSPRHQMMFFRNRRSVPNGPIQESPSSADPIKQNFRYSKHMRCGAQGFGMAQRLRVQYQ